MLAPARRHHVIGAAPPVDPQLLSVALPQFASWLVDHFSPVETFKGAKLEPIRLLVWIFFFFPETPLGRLTSVLSRFLCYNHPASFHSLLGLVSFTTASNFWPCCCYDAQDTFFSSPLVAPWFSSSKHQSPFRAQGYRVWVRLSLSCGFTVYLGADKTVMLNFTTDHKTRLRVQRIRFQLFSCIKELKSERSLCRLPVDVV